MGKGMWHRALARIALKGVIPDLARGVDRFLEIALF